jgi:hypothetical protein
LLIFSTIVLLYWYYGKRVIAKRRAIRAFESSVFRDKLIEMSVDDEGIVIKPNKKLDWGEMEIVSSACSVGVYPDSIQIIQIE